MNVWVMVGLGVIVLGLLVVGLIVREGRRLMGSRAGVFRNFARRRAWKYRVEDDGRAQEALEGLVALDPDPADSSRMTRPQNVIEGTVEEGDVLIFTFARRIDGENIPFQVALIETDYTFPDHVVMRFGRDRADGTDRAEPLYANRNFRKANGIATSLPNEEPELLTSAVRRRLANVVSDLPWPVDLQVLEDRVAVYTTDRSETSPALRMEQLLSAAQKATSLLLSGAEKHGPS